MVVARGEIWWADLAAPRGSGPGLRRPVGLTMTWIVARPARATSAIPRLHHERRRRSSWRLPGRASGGAAAGIEIPINGERPGSATSQGWRRAPSSVQRPARYSGATPSRPWPGAAGGRARALRDPPGLGLFAPVQRPIRHPDERLPAAGIARERRRPDRERDRQRAATVQLERALLERRPGSDPPRPRRPRGRRRAAGPRIRRRRTGRGCRRVAGRSG